MAFNKPIRTLKVEEEEETLLPMSPTGQCLSERLSSNQPLWEVHVVKYPSMNGAGSLVFKFSHALGDGYSIVSVIFSAIERADDPSLPLTLPNMSLSITGGKKSLWNYFMMCFNTVSDLSFSVLKGSVLVDSKSAVRSGMVGVEFEPIAISSISISMERLNLVKSEIGGTVNDVVTGLIYYIIHLYMLRKGDTSGGKNMNLLVMFNMRMLGGYKNIAEMMKANIWGNRVAFLHAPIPNITGEEKIDPLYFINKGKEVMDRKKNSLFTFLTNPIINVLRCLKGPKGVADYVHSNFKNTTTTVTSLIGPKEKLALAGHPISSSYFIVAGIPQSLVFTVASCMGQLRLVATTQKNFIDSQPFAACMREAFENIFDAACDHGRNP
ncbi:hypothetical protein IFM89_038164 [Coptis chinensis]|uniref:Diacylglycerol O-acyltransferase n=1 Tax=Coptis chinensis TaxID=261450 RepID=A0A835HV76_9MAGN|nr:hypothetical protein IFM89_038164 [Coptis chinensis]